MHGAYADVYLSIDLNKLEPLACEYPRSSILQQRLIHSPVYFLVRNINNLEDDLCSGDAIALADVASTASFLGGCLALDPATRPQLDELFL